MDCEAENSLLLGPTTYRYPSKRASGPTAHTPSLFFFFFILFTMLKFSTLLKISVYITLHIIQIYAHTQDVNILISPVHVSQALN